MNDLGYTPPPPKQNLNATPVTIVSEEDAERKPQYPSISFNGPQAEAAGLTKCSHGDVYEITVRIKATRIGGWSYPGSNGGDEPPMEFDVISASDPVEVEDEAEDTKEGGKEEPKAKTVTAPKRGPRVIKPPMEDDEEED